MQRSTIKRGLSRMSTRMMGKLRSEGDDYSEGSADEDADGDGDDDDSDCLDSDEDDEFVQIELDNEITRDYWVP